MNQKKFFFLSIIVCLFLLSSANQASARSFWQQGWNHQPIAYTNNGWGAGTAYGADIDGQIGYPLTVAPPNAGCFNDNGQSVGWSGIPSITSGTLPPGITMDPSNAQMNGIPTARGHWIVEIGESSVICDGVSYPSFTQELRFHIKGSGEINE